jgi:hypothetical protein
MPVAIGQGFSLHTPDLGGPLGLLEEALRTARDDTPNCALDSSLQCVACAHFLPWVCRTSGRNAKRSCRTGSREGFRMADFLDAWQSFWDIASPQQAAKAMASTYGEAARRAALQCAAAAEADNRLEDSRFWCAVAWQLRGTTDGAPAATAATGPLGRAGGR